jgi:hypothetical protein
MDGYIMNSFLETFLMWIKYKLSCCWNCYLEINPKSVLISNLEINLCGYFLLLDSINCIQRVNIPLLCWIIATTSLLFCWFKKWPCFLQKHIVMVFGNKMQSAVIYKN